MKFKHQEDGETTRISLSGLIEVESCTCLSNFWSARVAGATQLDVNLAAADLSDDAGARALAELIGGSAEEGTTITLRGVPPPFRELIPHHPRIIVADD